jgi:putative oxidoreductase
MAKDLGLLALRVTAGGLLAGHGAQKLFGVLGGYGLEGTGGWLESIGLKPGKTWAMMAGASEFGSGVLMALGLMSPVGEISTFGPMAMAWATVHKGKPIWVTSGGAELVLMYMMSATTLAFTGPGRYSLDEVLNVEVPTSLIVLTTLGVAGGVAAGIMMQAPPPSEEQVNQGGGELQAGEASGGNGADTALAAGA